MTMVDIHLFFDRLRPPLESQLLTGFVSLRPGDRVLEVGCGSGYISLALGWKHPFCREIVGVDIDPGAVREAEKNRDELQTIWKGYLPPIRFQRADVGEMDTQEPRFDVLVSNPPFFSAKASRPSPSAARRAARQDYHLAPEILMAGAGRLLNPGGRLAVVYPTLRVHEIYTRAREHAFEVIKEEIHSGVRTRNGGIRLLLMKRQEPF